MSSSRLVRGAKTRMFACVCLICVLGALVYVFHGTQARLADVQKLANDCNQQQESLSAQLQVIFEYKLRLEKSLKKEKADHDQTKESCKAKEKEEREAREKEKAEANNRYEALVQQNKLQKTEFEDEKEELGKTISAVRDEKKTLEASLQSLKEEMQVYKQDKETALENLKTEFVRLQDENKKLKDANEELKAKTFPANEQINHLEKQNFQLTSEMEELQKSLRECNDKNAEKEKKDVFVEPEKTNALEAPKFVQSGNSSTTPGINPDALYSPDLSSPKPSAQRKLDEQVALPPKKSTQESGVQGMGGDAGNQVGQIPGPPDPPQQRQDAQFGPMNPVIEERRRDAAVEEDEPRQRGGMRMRGDHYHGGDYDKEQPEEEEDDEGEQLDYVQSNDQLRKEAALRHVQVNNDLGIMVNPK